MPQKAANDTAIYLIDASVYVFRAWFSIPDSLTDADGRPINALHGFAGFVADFLKRTQAQHVAFAFDESLTSSFRNEIDPEYKANREHAPEDLKRQFAACRALVEAMGMLTVAHERYEADDYIACFAHAAKQAKRDCIILSRDKDLTQLIDDQTSLWDFAGDVRWDADAVMQKFGVPPASMIDYQALVGDSVDNIPGVRGIGPKAAAALISHFGDLDSLYIRLDEVEALSLRGSKRIANLLADQKEEALRSRQLVTLLAEIPDEAMPEQWPTQSLRCLERRSTKQGTLEAVCKKLGLGKGITARLTTSADI